ncbi:MAG: hypothetical protein GX657_02510 [Chloroflexi bacterium]|nr:hypothetical protein [Chloroflexota bacterium]
MAEYLTNQCGPADRAPTVTHKVARCTVCGVEWQVRAAGVDDQGCAFCGAPRRAIRIQSERPDHSGSLI